VRLAIVIDSATTEEMRALQGAYHAVMKDAEKAGDSGLWDHGTSIAVKSIGGSSWNAATPKVPADKVTELLTEYATKLALLGAS
jgi:hypothetical protein